MSYLRGAINTLSEGHDLDVERGIDHPKKVQGDCHLSSGIEATFVSAFANFLYSHSSLDLHYHQFVYIPNTVAEGLVGYDLSIGNYNDSFRIRTMHKVLNKTWCDQNWDWSFGNPNDGYNNPEDFSHFKALLHNSEEFEDIHSFLVIHVCYCIHEYRRMGENYEGLIVPELNSLLRTVIISLDVINKRVDNLSNLIDDGGFELSVNKNITQKDDDENKTDYIVRLSEKSTIDVCIQPGDGIIEGSLLSLDELVEKFDSRGI